MHAEKIAFRNVQVREPLPFRVAEGVDLAAPIVVRRVPAVVFAARLENNPKHADRSAIGRALAGDNPAIRFVKNMRDELRRLSARHFGGELGAGFYSRVCVDRDDPATVWKLARKGVSYHGTDCGWFDGGTAFAAAILDGAITGPHLPTIHEMLVGDGGQVLIRMKRLAQTAQNSRYWVGDDVDVMGRRRYRFDLIRDDFDHLMNNRQPRLVGDAKTSRTDVEGVRRVVWRLPKNVRAALAEVGRLTPTLRAIVDTLGQGWDDDLHAANAMTDAENNLYITDPLAGWRGGHDLFAALCDAAAAAARR